MAKQKDEFTVIVEIAKRAEKMGLMASDRLSLIMDLDCVDEQHDLRLEELLEADDGNFSHDIVGIQNNINRAERKLENFFLPRYATK